MRVKDKSKYDMIYDKIKLFMIEKKYIPSRRELARTLEISHAIVCRYMQDMEDQGLIKRVGRTYITADTETLAIPILNSLSNPNHIFDRANVKDYIFVSKKSFGVEGELAILTIPDNSMCQANIIEGSWLVAKRQRHAEYGQIVLVLGSDNKFYLRRYEFDEVSQKAVLLTESTENYYTAENYQIRAIAITTIAHIK